MGNISEMELQNLRHLLLSSQMEEGKYQTYAEQSSDPNVKKYFEKATQSAMKNKQDLMQFLR